MADTLSAQEVQDRINNISSNYDARFAGKARATRNPEELEALIEQLEEVLNAAPQGDELTSALETGRQNLDLYRDELHAIHEARAEGPHVIAAANLATWANFVFDEYRRHYAGQNRATRDIGRMEEMIMELEAIQDDMKALIRIKDMDSVKSDLQAVENNLEMYRTELTNIRSARESGNRQERADILANAANEQFRVYNEQFAGKGRATRRPALLERMINNLDDILHDMRDLNAGGLRNSSNTRNIGIVQDNMKMYRGELKEILNARKENTDEDRGGMLGGAANDVMAEYRENFAGQNRATRDLDKLKALCDELYEIAIQMREIQDEHPELEMNNDNLTIVMDNLTLYHSEYRRIQEAKGIA